MQNSTMFLSDLHFASFDLLSRPIDYVDYDVVLISASHLVAVGVGAAFTVKNDEAIMLAVVAWFLDSN